MGKLTHSQSPLPAPRPSIAINSSYLLPEYFRIRSYSARACLSASTAYADVMTLNRSSAPGSLFLSGWNLHRVGDRVRVTGQEERVSVEGRWAYFRASLR